MTKRQFIVKGVGKMMSRKVNAITGLQEVFALATMTSMAITMNVEINDIMGGDGLYAIDDIAVSKSIEVKATETKFSPQALRLMMGESGAAFSSDYTLREQFEKHMVGGTGAEVQQIVVLTGSSAAGDVTLNLNGIDFVVSLGNGLTQIQVAEAIGATAAIKSYFIVDVVGDTVRLTRKMAGDIDAPTFDDTDTTGVSVFASTVVSGSGSTNKITPKKAGSLSPTPEFFVFDIDTGEYLAQTAGVVGANDFSVGAGGILTLHASRNGHRVAIDYTYNESNLSIYTFQADELPFYVELTHKGLFEQKDNYKHGVQTTLYTCRARGTYTLDFNRAQASPVEVNLKVINPERPDGRLGIVKFFTESASA